MAKVVELSRPRSPWVRWEYSEHFPRALEEPPFSPPDADGYWTPETVVASSHGGLYVKWVWHHGPDHFERAQRMAQSAEALLNAVRSRAAALQIDLPDTSGDKWVWESMDKVTNALVDRR